MEYINSGFANKIDIGNKLFPIFLKLEKLKVLIVGGGNVALEKLNAGWQAASQDMYNAQNADANAQANANGPEAKGDGEVTDVDFEEVKDEKK